MLAYLVVDLPEADPRGSGLLYALTSQNPTKFLASPAAAPSSQRNNQEEEELEELCLSSRWKDLEWMAQGVDASALRDVGCTSRPVLVVAQANPVDLR